MPMIISYFLLSVHWRSEWPLVAKAALDLQHLIFVVMCAKIDLWPSFLYNQARDEAPTLNTGKGRKIKLDPFLRNNDDFWN